LFIVVVFASNLQALDPNKSLAQYSRTVWTQAQGLHQETIRALAQTKDGYLWLATDEGLVRFDGYSFSTFNKINSDLQDDSITALTASSDGSLWIGTASGLAHYRDKNFQTYTAKQGLPEDYIRTVVEDDEGTVWVVAGSYLSRYQGGKFTNFETGVNIPTAYEDHHHGLWIGGFGGVAKLIDGKFALVVDSTILEGQTALAILVDSRNNLWIGTTKELIKRSPSGNIQRYDGRDGPLTVRALREDRDGNVWVVSNAGLGRIKGDRVTSNAMLFEYESLRPLCIFEDREGNLWVGSNSGLNRFREATFTTYGVQEGLPSDEANVVFQDHSGRIWIGFRDKGLMLFSPGRYRVFTTKDGLPDNYIISIRESRSGELLIGTQRGLACMRGMHISVATVEPLVNTSITSILEESTGQLWVATARGLARLKGKEVQEVIALGLYPYGIRSLFKTPDGALWIGINAKGLWRFQDKDRQLFTTADGLSSDRIRSLSYDTDRTLWIGTFGGGLNAFRDGHFIQFTAKDGLLSDYIANIIDDGDSLWLSTTLGICRISKQQLREFADKKRRALEPINYDMNDGLRSGQIAPDYLIGGGTGGTRTSDGRLWFTTGRGLAVFNPQPHIQAVAPPMVHIEDVTADAFPVDLRHPARLSLKSGRIEINYSAIHLTTPDRVRYSYKLEGLDKEWVDAGNRRLANYNNLGHGRYRFIVRAELPDRSATEESYEFELLPKFYETLGFRATVTTFVVVLAFALYQLTLRQIRYRFRLITEERARLAREIHDTLAQDVFGISTQLEALASQMPKEATSQNQCLDIARRMAAHCLTEARRAVMDLRAPGLDGRDLKTALESEIRAWTAGSGLEVDVEISRPHRTLSHDAEQHLLRIIQEAVNNTLKHAKANRILIKLHEDDRILYLNITDDGRGFQQQDESMMEGHFGLLGMHERAKRLGGELRLVSHPGDGTSIEVLVPLQ
jgi:signal transduction histidine kinase/ligand-binding sensor domain-containing protein